MTSPCCEHCDEVTQLRPDVAVIKAIVERLEPNMVTRAEFRPVKAIAYGVVAAMTAAAVAIAAQVVK
jgi:hypothetical protein